MRWLRKFPLKSVTCLLCFVVVLNVCCATVKGKIGSMNRPKGYYVSTYPFLCHATLPHYSIHARIEQVYADLDYLESGLLRYQSATEHSPIPDWLLESDLRAWEKEALNRCADIFIGAYRVQIEDLNDDIAGMIEILKEHEVFGGGFAAMNRFQSVLVQLDEPFLINGCPNPRTLDPFSGYSKPYGYSTQLTGDSLQFLSRSCYILRSVGPDGDEDIDISRWKDGWPYFGQDRKANTYRYDPTNGIVSEGDIFFFWSNDEIPEWK